MCDGDTVRAPALLSCLQPRLNLILQGIQAEVEMLGLTSLRGGAIEFAARVNEPTSCLRLLVSRRIPVRLQGVEEVSACIALPMI
jgi:hypothetical protein